MSKTSIKVQYVNQPKSPKGPGNVKTAEGVYYKVWPKAKDGGATLSQFEEGRTYEVEYDTEKYQGEDRFTIRKILSSSESVVTSSSNGQAGNGRDEVGQRIERQSALKVAVQLLTLQVQAGSAAPTPNALFILAGDIEEFIGEAGQVKPESSEIDKSSGEPEVEI